DLGRRLLAAAPRRARLAGLAGGARRVPHGVPVLPAVADRRRVQGLRGGLPLPPLPAGAARAGEPPRAGLGRGRHGGRATAARAVAGAVAGGAAGRVVAIPGAVEQGVRRRWWDGGP